MRNLLAILFFIVCVSVNAQSRNTTDVLAKTKLLQATVFGTKDSATLDGLFAMPLTYIHSSGKAETREEAIHGISHNKSIYRKAAEVTSYDVKNQDDSLIVTHVYRATEKKTDGTESALDLTITFVWAKEKGQWKLFRRQAVKNH